MKRSLVFLAVALLLPSSTLAQTPAYITQWGSRGTGPGQFTFPAGVAADASGNVYVTDILSRRALACGYEPSMRAGERLKSA